MPPITPELIPKSKEELPQSGMSQLEINYLRGEIRSLSDTFREFMGKQDGRFESLSSTYVRKDLLDLRLQTMCSDLGSIKDGLGKLMVHLPMIEDIKKERESLKNQFITMIGKGLLWIGGVIFAIYLAVK